MTDPEPVSEELTAVDVDDFTNGRLRDDAGGGETTRLLNAALTVARRRVGWHVSPVIEDDEIVTDGPGWYKLYLPTRKIVTVASIEDGGVEVDAADYVVAANVPGLVIRTAGTWSDDMSAITVTLDHGFTAAEAADWRQAILMMVDQMSMAKAAATGTRADVDLVRKKVNNVEYQWTDGQSLALAETAVFSVENILCGYELIPALFV